MKSSVKHTSCKTYLRGLHSNVLHKEVPMTLWRDDIAASTELWAALTGEKKHISEDKHF